MKIQGKILDVKDGDAIIIQASKEGEHLIVVIDGGDRGHGAKVLKEVQQCCENLGKEGPDLVVCTHYDSDHIAGIITLIEYYKSKIKKIWIHQPKGVIKDSLRAAPMVLEYISNKAEPLDFNGFVLHQNYLSANQLEKYKLVIESVDQLNTLLGLIKKYKIPTEQPIAGKCFVSGWAEIGVIGPTEQYFSKVFEKQNSLLQIFQEEYEDMILEDVRKKSITGTNPCEALKKTSDITPTNKASAIIRFDCEDGNYLFTADAGIESFTETLGYPESIQQLKFLKVPHHGSINNISKELIELMDPEIAYSSGDRYEDKEVIACLRRKEGRVVLTTKESGDLTF